MTGRPAAYGEVIYTHATPALAGLVLLFNVIVVAIIIKKVKLKPSLIYILNLCLSDTFVGINMIILKSMDPFMKTTLKGKSEVKELYSIIKHVFIRFSLLISIFNLIAITFDRLFAVAFPFLHHKQNKLFPYKICFSAWVLSLACVSLVYCVSRFLLSNVEKYNNLVFPVLTYTATIFFVACYTAIFVVLRRSNNKLKQISAAAFESTGKHNVGRDLKREVWMISSFCYAFAYFRYSYVNIIVFLKTKKNRTFTGTEQFM
ncbi:trace amine-associated receptor 13c-like [Hydractinia symbiolongicarpus]|uniref:trace amine-associated receptor 13c-like n=1 Tax=Hydractinia symbiolongicarpus TaxID=13093 RepID=UPI00254B75AF|nr:trace amine-associated receptor 13c-like [Hydractinia symbiolongicarpus]XP_057310286.1 trace amine-associated receptor 13c-like [Hydractinia symbiolongicarpus]